MNTDTVTPEDAKKLADDTRERMEILIQEAKEIGLEAVKAAHYREVFPLKNKTA